MQFDAPLVPGRLIRRYTRFLADVALEDGTVVTVHCPNPGSMLGLDAPGLDVWLSDHAGKKRKLRYTLELLRLTEGPEAGVMVGINTGMPNRLAEEAIRTGGIADLAGYAELRREVRYGRNSRVDLLLTDRDRPACWVEVKNVHLRRPSGTWPTAAEFPDSVTTRGAKHLRDLTEQVAAGDRAVMLFIVQRADCDRFRPAEDIDPAYATGLRQAAAAGVEVLCYACTVACDGIEVDNPLPIDLGPSAPL